MAGRKRRVGGEGSIYQAHTPGCPPEDANGDRPKHGCQGRWRGYVDLGWHDGKRDRRYVSGKTRRDVSNKLEKLKTEAAAGVRSDSTTVSEWMTYWLGHVAPRRCAESTLKTYRGYVDTWISPRIGSKRLSRLTPADVRELHAAMAGVGRAGATQRQVHSILRRALKVAVQDGKIPSNPAERVDSPENDGGHHAELTTAQSLAVLQAATGERERARVFVALLTGLRQGEALGLDWRDVDLDAGALRIRQVAQRVKGQGVKLLPRIKSGAGKERWVALLPEVAAALRDWQRVSGGVGLVFGDGQMPTRPELDYKQWKRVCERAGVPAVPPHGARASTATRLQELGVPAFIVADVLGHADIAVTLSRYTRSNLEAQQRAFAALPPLLAVDG